MTNSTTASTKFFDRSILAICIVARLATGAVLIAGMDCTHAKAGDNRGVSASVSQAAPTVTPAVMLGPGLNTEPQYERAIRRSRIELCRALGRCRRSMVLSIHHPSPVLLPPAQSRPIAMSTGPVPADPVDMNPSSRRASGGSGAAPGRATAISQQ